MCSDKFMRRLFHKNCCMFKFVVYDCKSFVSLIDLIIFVILFIKFLFCSINEFVVFSMNFKCISKFELRNMNNNFVEKLFKISKFSLQCKNQIDIHFQSLFHESYMIFHKFHKSEILNLKWRFLKRLDINKKIYQMSRV